MLSNKIQFPGKELLEVGGGIPVKAESNTDAAMKGRLIVAIIAELTVILISEGTTAPSSELSAMAGKISATSN